MCIDDSDSFEQEHPQGFRISGGHAQGRREEPRFVLPFVMQRIEAMVSQPGHVDFGTIGVGDEHPRVFSPRGTPNPREPILRAPPPSYGRNWIALGPSRSGCATMR